VNFLHCIFTLAGPLLLGKPFLFRNHQNLWILLQGVLRKIVGLERQARAKASPDVKSQNDQFKYGLLNKSECFGQYMSGHMMGLAVGKYCDHLPALRETTNVLKYNATRLVMWQPGGICT